MIDFKKVYQAVNRPSNTDSIFNNYSKAIKTEVVTEKWDSSFLDTSITIEKCNLGTKLFYIKKFANHHCKTLLPIPDLMFKIFISGI